MNYAIERADQNFDLSFYVRTPDERLPAVVHAENVGIADDDE